jgi:hypothetical protein
VRPCIRPQGVLWTLFLCGLSIASSLNAQVSDGPLGLSWGMPKEAVERLGIRLCCRQVGTWGTRYTVARQDFNKMPRSFGDEEKIYLYFGNKNKPTVSLDVISLVASSCGYYKSQIAHRVAHKFAVYVATQRGLAERLQHRHPPRAQPVAPMRACHYRRP